MSDIDKMMLEEFVPFREKVVEAVKAMHPYISSLVEHFMAGRRNSVGFRVTEAER